MTVRRISARRNPKTGRVAITFEIDAETWGNMGRSAEAGGHPDALDYIADRINAALLDDDPLPDKKPGESDDIEDDLPF